MKVYIAQLKCPNNHCVLAMVGEFEDQKSAETALALQLGLMMGEAVKTKLLKHECVLCKSTDLNIQVAATKYATLQDARPDLQEMERQQALTREYFTKWSLN